MSTPSDTQAWTRNRNVPPDPYARNHSLADDRDYLDDLKTIIQTLLAYVPEVGAVLSALVRIFWPFSGPDVWDQIRKKVEAMIDQKIDDAVFSLLKSELVGLGDAVRLYANAAATGDTDNLRMQFIATNTVMTAASAKFRNPDFEWVLGPLFAIFAQMHVALLRDCVLLGKGWGWSEATYESYVRTTGSTIQSYIAYLNCVVDNRKKFLTAAQPGNAGPHRTTLYNYWQPFTQRKIELFDDFVLLLESLDPIKHPEPVKSIPFKDVFTPAYGTADNWDDTAQAWAQSVTTPFDRPLANISEIHVEQWNFTPRVVDVTYPNGNGPRLWSDDKNRIDRVGIIAGAVDGVKPTTITIPRPEDGKTFNIDQAFVRAGSIPTALYLWIDGNPKPTIVWDRQDLGGDSYNIAFPGRKLTTLAMWTRSSFYQYDLGCIILGFSRDPTHVPKHIREILYTSSPSEPAAEAPWLPSTISPALQSERSLFFEQLQDFHARAAGA